MPQANTQRADSGDQAESARCPVDTAKVGNVEIAIWRNHGQNGDFYTASTPTLRYKDEKSGEFKDGSSYGAIDLLTRSEAAREASTKIRDQTGPAPQVTFEVETWNLPRG